MKKSTNIFWGFALIGIGFCYLVSLFTDWNFNIIQWWTLIIVLISVSSMIARGVTVGNFIGAIIGIMFLPPVAAILDSDIIRRLILPGVLIIIGVMLIVKEIAHRNVLNKSARYQINENKVANEGRKKNKRSGMEEYYATFSSNNIIYPNDIFLGADVSASFGSVTLDLKDAIITKDVVINCSASFGGIEIFVPQRVNLKISSTPVFGGVTNKYNNENNPNAPTIYINATCIFGGVDIK